MTGVTIRDVKISGKPHKSIALSLKGELPFGVAGALAHPTYVRSPVLPKVAHLHLSLLYSATIDEETGYVCASVFPSQPETEPGHTQKLACRHWLLLMP